MMSANVWSTIPPAYRATEIFANMYMHRVLNIFTEGREDVHEEGEASIESAADGTVAHFEVPGSVTFCK